MPGKYRGFSEFLDLKMGPKSNMSVSAMPCTCRRQKKQIGSYHQKKAFIFRLNSTIIATCKFSHLSDNMNQKISISANIARNNIYLYKYYVITILKKYVTV